MNNVLVPTILMWLITLTPISASGQDADYRSYYSKGIAAYKGKDYPGFYSLMKEANALHPFHQGILYQLGMASALTGHKAEAIADLKKALLIDNSFRIEGLSDFNSLKEMPDYKKLLALQAECSIPVVHSDTAVLLKDRTLHCEGLDYDPVTNTFYIGSIHQRKIIKIKDGVSSDFCPSGGNGMEAIFGLKIDLKNKFLWACTSPVPEMENFDSTVRSAVFKFDINTGVMLEKIQQPSWKTDGVFGDLILNKNGEVLVTDSQTNTILVINSKTKQLEPWHTSPELWNIQGIAFSDDEKYLFIADYIKGFFRLEVKTKTLQVVACSLDVSLKGVDGLCFYDNSLIAVQNGVNPFRVTRYYLNSGKDRVTSFEIIDRKHPAFNEPTLGVVHNDVFYYIANSQWSGYDRQHRIKSNDKLQDIVVLRCRLK